MAIDDKNILLREEAEKKLKEFSEEENFHLIPPEQIARLVHDLRVHQIELEIQNEHLRQLEIKQELSSKRYFELYDLAPVGYCTLDELGIIKESNLSASTSLGLERKKLINQSITNFIIKQDQDIFYFFKKMLFETEKSENFELRMV